MGITKWLKTWGALVVGVIALGLSGYAVVMDNVHYQEVTKPHTQHDEIYNKLVRLDDKIERVQHWSITGQELGQDISELQINLREATELRDQAELAWINGQYTDADSLINKAFNILQEIPQPKAPLSWWLWLVVGLVVVAFAATLGIVRYRREGYQK